MDTENENDVGFRFQEVHYRIFFFSIHTIGACTRRLRDLAPAATSILDFSSHGGQAKSLSTMTILI